MITNSLFLLLLVFLVLAFDYLPEILFTVFENQIDLIQQQNNVTEFYQIWVLLLSHFFEGRNLSEEVSWDPLKALIHEIIDFDGKHFTGGLIEPFVYFTEGTFPDEQKLLLRGESLQCFVCMIRLLEC